MLSKGKEVTLIQRSDWQEAKDENVIELIYGKAECKDNAYVISKEENFTKQQLKIKEIIKKESVNKVKIYDINNAIPLINMCEELNISCTIHVDYPINWVDSFSKFYFQNNGISGNIKIAYEDPDYEKQYKKLLLEKEIKPIEQLGNIKGIFEQYEQELNRKIETLNNVQNFANYLQNELNIYKNSKTVKFAKIICFPARIIKKVLRKYEKVWKAIVNVLKYIKNYGLTKFAKKIYYKLIKYNDIPLWENDKESHYQDLYEFKFFRFKEAQSSLKIDLNKLKYEYEKGLVSIVLPVYNGEDLLEEALNSIINQTYKKFECIMVNDGSTDNTIKIMKEFAKKDKRFIILDQKNAKLPKALNNGFKLAKGEFYTWTSCDNNMHPQYIERMVKQLKQDKSIDFIYADLKLIDENSEILRGFGWYEIPENSGNVILPTNINHLNVYPNNYIGAAFMYRGIVHKMLSDYSTNRYTVEDYDYWQRINSLFKIKKARLSEPLYYYRFHSKSLTAQTKELKINDKRDEMMLYDDFRRDFYLMPICWIIDYDEKTKKLYEILKKELIKNNQVILEKEQINSKSFSQKYSNVVYLNIKDDKEAKLSEKIFYGNIEQEGKNLKFKFKHYNEKIYEISASIKKLLKMIEIMAKDYFCIQYENELYKEQKIEKDLSIVICTYKRSEQLEEALISSINQTEDKQNYEILVINNDIESKEIEKLVNDTRKKHKLDETFLKYYVAPVKGLSYARNTGMWEATGKYILYIDDDSVCDKDNVKEIIKAFKDNPNAGVVGGNIILRVPKDVDDIYLPQYAGLWSQYKMEGHSYTKIDEWYGYPYGANIGTLRESLLKIGGFRTAYGRKENDFSGGEEIVISSLISKLGKEIIINPNAKVDHAVCRNRFSKEHIKYTNYSGMLTWYRLYLDMYINEVITLKDIEYRIGMIENKYKKEICSLEKYYIDCEKEAGEKLKEYFYTIDSKRQK